MVDKPIRDLSSTTGNARLLIRLISGPFEVGHKEVIPVKASSAVVRFGGGNALCGRVADGIVAVVRGQAWPAGQKIPGNRG